jgi:hypothetical protein
VFAVASMYSQIDSATDAKLCKLYSKVNEKFTTANKKIANSNKNVTQSLVKCIKSNRNLVDAMKIAKENLDAGNFNKGQDIKQRNKIVNNMNKLINESNKLDIQQNKLIKESDKYIKDAMKLFDEIQNLFQEIQKTNSDINEALYDEYSMLIDIINEHGVTDSTDNNLQNENNNKLIEEIRTVLRENELLSEESEKIAEDEFLKMVEEQGKVITNELSNLFETNKEVFVSRMTELLEDKCSEKLLKSAIQAIEISYQFVELCKEHDKLSIKHRKQVDKGNKSGNEYNTLIGKINKMR